MKRMQVAGAVLLLVSLAGAWADARMFLAAWLAAWWWCLGVVLGCFVNAWMHVLSGGGWGMPVRAAALRVGDRMPWLLLALLPVAIGLAHLYPWAADPNGEWVRMFKRPAFPQAWLSQPFFLLRLALYALAWWWLTRPAALAGKGRAAASLVVYAIVTSLAAVDLLMSLVPGWFSTGFGLVVLSTQALSGAAVAVLLNVTQLPRPPHAIGTVPLSRDLGNLLLMWTMSWAYLAFMQFLIIWSENLPREIAWYVPRLQTGWVVIAVALVVLQLAVPFVALLFRSVKDHPSRLAVVAAVVLLATALDATWLVLPSVDAHGLQSWWQQPLVTAGMAMLLFGHLPPCAQGQTPVGEGMRHARP
jgi:hypothetical protein